MDINRKKLAVSILKFLDETKNQFPTPDAESYDVVRDCIESIFGISTNDASLQTNQDLLDIFTKATTTSNNTNTTTTTTTTTTTSPTLGNTPVIDINEIKQRITSEIPDELSVEFNKFLSILEQKGAFNDPTSYERVLRASKDKFFESKAGQIKQIAESLKEEGNKKLTGKDLRGALDCYSKAIKYDDSNAIYYANRSACYHNLSEFDKSIQDAQESIKRNPKYAKAYARLGAALLSSNKPEDAVEAYKTALSLEPNNEVFKSSLSNAESKVGQTSQAPQMPDLGGLDFNNLTQTLNGMGGLSGLMQNDMFKSLYNSVVQNPDSLNQLLNPETLKAVQNMMGKK